MREDAARPGRIPSGEELLRGERLSYDFIAGQRMGERRSSPRVNNVSGRGARREAASLRLSRRPAHGEENAACPGCVASALGEAARRESASLLGTADRRMSKLRPSCQRQPRRGHEEPVGVIDLSATDRRTPTDWWRTGRRERSVPDVQRRERSTPNRQTGSQRKERSTPAVRRVSSGRKRSTPTR